MECYVSRAHQSLLYTLFDLLQSSLTRVGTMRREERRVANTHSRSSISAVHSVRPSSVPAHKGRHHDDDDGKTERNKHTEKMHAHTLTSLAIDSSFFFRPLPQGYDEERGTQSHTPWSLPSPSFVTHYRLLISTLQPFRLSSVPAHHDDILAHTHSSASYSFLILTLHPSQSSFPYVLFLCSCLLVSCLDSPLCLSVDVYCVHEPFA